MEDLMAVISQELIGLLGVVITGFIGWASVSVKGYFNKKGVIKKIDAHKELANIAVNFVEQAFIDFKGEEKLDKAKAKLVELANENKIKITDADLDAFIENAVREMKSAGKENK